MIFHRTGVEEAADTLVGQSDYYSILFDGLDFVDQFGVRFVDALFFHEAL